MRSDADWAVPATLFVLAQFAIGLMVREAIGYPIIPPTVPYLVWSGIVTLFALAVFIFIEVVRLWRGQVPEDDPLAIIRQRLPVLALMVYGCLLVGQQFATLTWLKSMLPLAVPFWADPYLAAFDKALFLGAEPWRVLHSILPKSFEWFVDAVYLSWFPIKAYTLGALLSLPPSRFKSRALLAYFLMIGLFGVLGQYALSSAGPVFYHLLGFGSDYKGLHMTAAVLTERNYLWVVYQHRHMNFGGGISAMPSVHVALACWLALTLRSIWPRLQVFGWSFFAIIVFGSVYLGWHYAADGIAGTACALAAWKLSSFILEANWHLALRRIYAAQV